MVPQLPLPPHLQQQHVQQQQQHQQGQQKQQSKLLFGLLSDSSFASSSGLSSLAGTPVKRGSLFGTPAKRQSHPVIRSRSLSPNKDGYPEAVLPFYDGGTFRCQECAKGPSSSR